MAKKIKLLLLFLAPLLCSAQTLHSYLRQGNESYKKQNFKQADSLYRKALKVDSNSVKAKFNLGDALYKQNKMEEAQEYFKKLAENPTSDDRLKAESYHNLGNSLLKQNKLEESIEAYKKSLKINPTDEDTRYNLAYAQKKLKNQQEQQQQNKNGDGNGGGSENQQQQQQNDDQQQQQQQQQGMTKEDAQRILDALKNDEKKTKDKVDKNKSQNSGGSSNDKDW